MRYFALLLLVGGLLLASEAQPSAMTTPENTDSRWSVEKANAWYPQQPWPCGFNYIPVNAISCTEMRMPYCFDPAFIDKELGLAARPG